MASSDVVMLDMQTFVIFGAVVAPLAWAVVEATSKLIKKHMHDAAWYTFAMRMFAVVSGGAIGVFVHTQLGVESWRVGLLLGAGAGALSATIVRQYRKRIAADVGPDSEVK